MQRLIFAGGVHMFYKFFNRAKSAWIGSIATAATIATVTVVIIGGDSLPISAQSSTEYPPVKTCAGGALSGRTRDIVEHVESVSGKTCENIVASDFSSITSLDFRRHGWRQLRPGDFDGFSGLTNLRLGYGRITEIPENAFTGLTALTNLDIRSHYISTIHEDAFAPLTNLTNLTLFRNSLTTLHEDVFDGLTNLQEVNVRSNFISSLPSNIFSGLSNLQTLNLTDNQLTSNNLGFLANALPMIRTIALNENQLTSDGAGPDPDLPENIFNVHTTVSTLWLHDNGIKELPTSMFSGLASLRWIALEDNRLTQLQDGLFTGLTGLRILSADRNQIAALGAGLFNGPRTYAATLGAITNNDRLRFTFSDNLLTTLPSGLLTGLRNLYIFDIADNNVNSLPTGLLTGLSTLCTVRLNDNQLTELPSGFFADISAAAECSVLLYNNQFTTTQQNSIAGALGARADFTAPTTTERTVPADADAAETLANCGSGPLNGRTQKVAAIIFNAIPSSVRTTLSGSPSDSPANCSAVTTEHMKLIDIITLSNSITSFQANDLADLPNLAWIFMPFTGKPKVTTLPAGLFDGLTKLTTLNFNGSYLQSLPPGIFDDLESLRSLSISDNLLTSLPDGIFDNLNKLVILNLDDNRLTELPDGVFSNIREIRNLGIARNQLDSDDFPVGIFNGLNNLQELRLDGNNFMSLYIDRFVNQGMDRLRSLHLAEDDQFPTDQELRQFRAELPALTQFRFESGSEIAPPTPTPTAMAEATVTPTPTFEERLGLPLVSRIEPGSRTLSVSVGFEVQLSVVLYDLQNGRDDNISSQAMRIVWDGPQGGSFSEAGLTGTDGDGNPDDRVVLWRAPSLPGKHTVTATVKPDWACGGDETECSATFNIGIVSTASSPTPEPTPCPTTGIVPTSVTDSDGNAYSVVTPAEGGEFLGDGASVDVPRGALTGCEQIAIRMYTLTAASGTTFPGWTTAGNRYRVDAVDINGAPLQNLVMRRPASVCVPLPNQFRATLTGITLLSEDGTSATQLTSSVRLHPSNGATLCGNVSTFPATVIASGPASSTISEPPSPTPEAGTPEAGGTSPTAAYILLALVLAVSALLVGTLLVGTVLVGTLREASARATKHPARPT